MSRKTFGLKHPTLTKKQILALDAGWQLDEAVARLVMGWQMFAYQPVSAIQGRDAKHLIPPGEDDHVSNVKPTPAYSTNEHEALKVINRVGCNCTWRIELSSEHCVVEVGGLSVLLCHDEPSITLQSDNRSDFAKLVCQAALLSDCVQGACQPIPDEQRWANIAKTN